MVYKNMVQSAIEQEKNGIDYTYPDCDKIILKDMLNEVNKLLGTNIHYVAEIDMYNLSGAGEIFAKYIWKFTSQDIRAYLIPQIVADKIENCAELIVNLYEDFRASNEFIAMSGKPAPAHIYIRYDNAFKNLKPKKHSEVLMKFVSNPRDAMYLSLTVNMLASWKIPELKEILFSFLKAEYISNEVLGIADDGEIYCPSASFIKRQLLFIGLQGLKYYPCEETLSAIEKFTSSNDKDISVVVKKTLKALRKGN